MSISSFLQKIAFLLFFGVLFSCDSDFNSVGANIVDNEDIVLDIYSSASITAYNKAIGPVQTNRLPLNSLGVINNPVFGKTISSYVTQLKLTAPGTNLATLANPVIESVELTIPYFNVLQSIEEDGARIFKLDSIYGNLESKFRLNVYESGYYLKEFDPSTNFEEVQRYYSDMYDVVNNAKNPVRLNNSTEVSQNDAFFFDKSEHVVYEEDENGEQVVKERLNPMMKLSLDHAFFQDKFFNAPSGQLENDNVFNSYFKGLFFQVEDLGLDSHLMHMNFSAGKIVIKYKAGAVGAREDGKIEIELKGNSVNLFQNYYTNTYTNALASANEITGDEKLYIKGGEGSTSYINLFDGPDSNGDGISDELQELRDIVNAENQGWLINEANLVFYIDKAQMDANPFAPQRIQLFNADEKAPLIDYYYDTTVNMYYPKFNKWIYGGILDKDSDNKGYRYKIRITKHIQNLLKNSDAKNVKLGLSVSEDINYLLMSGLLNGVGQPKTSPYLYVPASSVMNPFGTVVYGNNTTDADKKLKLEIRYTKKP
ncbi:MAG TPA: DUF4270 domain-containing protein [Flavobacterium sp.]|nr:DUF4270 domain-containing protein [Flavobacterium sp.]